MDGLIQRGSCISGGTWTPTCQIEAYTNRYSYNGVITRIASPSVFILELVQAFSFEVSPIYIPYGLILHFSQSCVYRRRITAAIDIYLEGFCPRTCRYRMFSRASIISGWATRPVRAPMVLVPVLQQTRRSFKLHSSFDMWLAGGQDSTTAIKKA
jgi:hypothetical protein